MLLRGQEGASVETVCSVSQERELPAEALRKPTPSNPNIRPAFLSGCLWAAGFTCFAHATPVLGFTAAFSLTSIGWNLGSAGNLSNCCRAGPVFVSQLLSFVMHRHIHDTWDYLCQVLPPSLLMLTGMALLFAGT